MARRPPLRRAGEVSRSRRGLLGHRLPTSTPFVRSIPEMLNPKSEVLMGNSQTVKRPTVQPGAAGDSSYTERGKPVRPVRVRNGMLGSEYIDREVLARSARVIIT